MATTDDSKPDDETTEPTPDVEEKIDFVPLAPRRSPTQIDGPSEATNLVTLLAGMKDKKGRDLLKMMASTVVDDYDADVKSRSQRMKKIDEFQKLYASIMKAKSFPFQNCANVNLPFLTYPSLMTHARLYDMVVPTNGKILLCSPTNLADVHRAATAEKFGNSYIRHQMSDWATGMDETLMQTVIYGSAFRRTYWNQYEERVCSDFIPIQDFVVAYGQKSVDPSMRDVPRYTMVQHLTIFDLEDYGADGIFENTDGLDAEDTDDNAKGEESEFKETIAKMDGVEPAPESSAEDKPRMVLEQHRKWRMPNAPKVHPDFDGRAHAVIITVDEKSDRVLRVVVREEDDPTDLKRYEREQAAVDQHAGELDAYRTAMQAHGDAMQIAAETGTDVSQLGPPPVVPAPPPGVQLDETGAPLPARPARRRPISFFTHYKCFPGEGFYGHGFGDFLAPIAKAANTILNQHIDGVTLTNARPGFISRQLRGQRGAISVQPGVLVEVDAPMGALRDGVHWLDPPQSDPTTMPLIELLRDMAEKFGGNDVMSGEPSGSNQTARGTMILNENALAQLSVLSKRVKESLKHELDKIWRCWGVFLSDEEVSADIVDENGLPGQVQVSRALFTPDARVMPASDPRMKSQKLGDSQAAYSMGMQDPAIAQNPQAMFELRKNVLMAMDANSIIPMIQPPPPAPPPPPVPHWQEDANFLRGQDQQVNANDDDQAHIEGHQAFMASPTGQMLDKTQRQMLENHIRHHAAQRLEKTASALQAMFPQPPIAPPPGPPGAEPMQEAA